MSYQDRVIELLELIAENTAKAKPRQKRPKKDESYTDGFEVFWKKFKGRWDKDKSRYYKGSKLEAWFEWKILTDEEQEKANSAAPYCGSDITPDACRWLKNKRWTDDQYIEKIKPQAKAMMCAGCGCKGTGLDIRYDGDRNLCVYCRQK